MERFMESLMPIKNLYFSKDSKKLLDSDLPVLVCTFPLMPMTL